MAESISEGTLKQFSKQVGDYVELDEEIATIETDKVRFNYPRSHKSEDLIIYRLMLQSMLLKPVKFWNSSPTKRTLSMLAKILSA